MSVRRYHVTLRRTATQTQSVIFIDDGTITTSDMQRAVAAAYARPEGWVDVANVVDVIDLNSETVP